jgi:hypothetical protein
VEGVGFGVAGGNIDGFWFELELRLFRRGLTRPTESERGGAERLVLARGRVGGGGGEAREAGWGDMYVASRDIWRWERKDIRDSGGLGGLGCGGVESGWDKRIRRRAWSCSSALVD